MTALVERGVTLEEALDFSDPGSLEQHKHTVLLAIRDLDYEHQLGKIAEQDYRQLRQRYRAEARRLLLHLDQTQAEARTRIEAEVNRRLSSKKDIPSSGSRE